jgi:hypothetical protein
MTAEHDFEAVTQLVVQQIAALFRTPVLIADVGVLRLLDHDESCVWIGLFPESDHGESSPIKPVMTWTIDASDMQQGD